MRFTAPPHMTSADLTCGPTPVIDGIIELPDNAGPGDIAGLIANGCVIIPVDTVDVELSAAQVVDAAPAKGRRADSAPTETAA
ncbi:hypothetical protein [Sphingomonas sp. HMP6]|uniref:hypothetical protein n=1 Tax=Sphingomonas sp. HMP6 TaxID=1517551 RepID=UPI00159695B3|nr:hypothetical protein [Sphingomonas sp. HMP6]BCA57688.1 hypothetical protein HMP06_0457 [Sphingomonas sp. HMP6]